MDSGGQGSVDGRHSTHVGLQDDGQQQSGRKMARLKIWLKKALSSLSRRASQLMKGPPTQSKGVTGHDTTLDQDRPEHVSASLNRPSIPEPAQPKTVAAASTGTQPCSNNNSNRTKDTTPNDAVELDGFASAGGETVSAPELVEVSNGASLTGTGLESSTQQGTQSAQSAPGIGRTPIAFPETTNAATNPNSSVIGVVASAPTLAVGAGDTTITQASGPSLESTWILDRAPCWNQALKDWQGTAKGRAECTALEALMADRQPDDSDFLRQLTPDVKGSSKWRLRLKRCEPIWNATRGLSVALANLDPHKVAPIAVHSVFAGINILFNRMSPENRTKMLDILFVCSDAIREGIAFETNCQIELEEDMQAIESVLPDLYLKALRLLYKVQKSCRDVQREHKSTLEAIGHGIMVRGSALWNELSDKMAVWEDDQDSIKRSVGQWIRIEKTMEKKIKSDEHVTKVRKWIRVEGDPESTLDGLKKNANPDGRYNDAAEWFLEISEFEAWCRAFQTGGERVGLTTHEPDANTATANDIATKQPSKRVLWLRGGYGTGKTTVFYHTYLALLEDPGYRLFEKELVIARYFCNATSTGEARPTYETIIRGLLRRLALSPDLNLVDPVSKLYKETTVLRASNTKHKIAETEVGEAISMNRWEEVFVQVIARHSENCHYVLVLDALDECSDSSEVEEVLRFMSKVLKDHRNVSLLCSSHEQVHLEDYFGPGNSHVGTNVLLTVDVTERRTASQMKRFIDGEVDRRRRIATKSIFCKSAVRIILMRTT